MKSIVFAVAALIASVAATPFSASAQLNPGDNLPTLETTMRSATGKSTTLKGAATTNGLLVMFSCNTCPFVVKNEPITKKTIAYAKAHNIGMIIINSNEGKRTGDDSYDAMVKYAKDQQYSVPYVIDENSKLADIFGANHTPEIFLFNGKNKLVYKGAMNDNPGSPDAYKTMYIEDAINAMLAGKTPDPATTKSVGCSIKRRS